MKKIKINEIYYTFSGEGMTKGLPVVIVRMSGCNLRCSYCDSRFAYEEGKRLTFDEVVERINKYKCGRVLLTGGEPLATPHCLDFVKYLSRFYYIILETNGSFPIENFLPHIQIVCMDVKCPSSGMTTLMRWENFDYLSDCKNLYEIKFVVGDKKDYRFAKNIIIKYSDHVSGHHYVFSPVWGKIEPKTLAEWILDDKLDVMFSLQMHKVIWDKDKRGV